MAKKKAANQESDVIHSDSVQPTGETVVNEADQTKAKPNREWKQTHSPETEADAEMEKAAIANKIPVGIIYRSRETTMKVKVHALNNIDKNLEADDISKDERAYWRKVKLDISTR